MTSSTEATSGNGGAATPGEVRVAGLVTDVRRRGGRVSMVLEDHTGRLEITLFEEVFNRFRHLADNNVMLVAEGQLRFDDFINDWRLTARTLGSVDETIENNASRLTIHWPEEGHEADFANALEKELAPFGHGNCEVCIEYKGSEATSRLTLGERWAVRPSRDLRDRLGALLGDNGFSIHYPRHFT